jgi:hypothetical protein
VVDVLGDDFQSEGRGGLAYGVNGRGRQEAG